MKRLLSPLCVLGLCVLGVSVGCGDDEEDNAPQGPSGPPSIRVAGFFGPDNQPIERSSSNVIEVCGTTLGVFLDPPQNWILRPPGRCGETPQCGHIAIRIDPSESGDGALAETSTPAALIDLSTLDPLAGPHLLRAELRLGSHAPFLDAAGMPVVDDVELELVPVECDQGTGGQGAGGQGGSGQGGSPGAGGSAGAGGEGGVPGAGGLDGGAGEGGAGGTG